MWTQKIEYTDAEVVLPPPVKKQVWDGERFVPTGCLKILDTQEYIETEDIGNTVERETLL